MAASSSGVEWGSIVKPILAASYGSFNKNYIVELAKAIIRSEAELLHHDEKFKIFYTAFSALAADYISSSISSVCKSQLGTVCSACRILLSYLLCRLKEGNADPSSQILSPWQLLLPIRALCSGQSSLSRSDQVALIALLKNAKLPPHIKTSIPGEGSGGETTGKTEGGSASKEQPPATGAASAGGGGKTRSRTDLSNQIMEQLTSPLLDYSLLLKTSSSTAEPSDGKSPESTPDKTSEIENVFIQQNISSLQSLGAADVLIDTCLQLSYLNRYISKYHTAISRKGFSLPSTFSEAQGLRHSLQSVVTDLNVAWNALSLPVLEPLTPSRLERLTSVVMGCLYTALSTATAASVLGVSSAVSPKTAPPLNSGGSKTNEEEVNSDALATTVVEKALEIFNLVSSVIKSSTRAGGSIHQNYVLMGGWLIISGLQGQLSASSQVPSEKTIKEDKGKSPSKCREGSARINLMKVQQGFGVLSVALASHALGLMGSLLEDVQFETTGGSGGGGVAGVVPSTTASGGAAGGAAQPPPPQSSSSADLLAELSITAQSTALQRALTVLSAAPINQFLFYLATVTYRKACTLKRIQKHPPEGDTFSTSDSTTYYEDDMSCSDESSPDVDDDSEPLLGLWFEEPIPDNENSSKPQSQDSQESIQKNVTEGSSSIVPEKGEPNGYISLATQIFNIMNKYLVTSRSGYLTRCVETGLAEQQMVMLAAIIRDLDRETARTDTGTISVYFGQVLGQLYTEFSQALTQYTHNLLARNLLSPSLQATLLLHLGVSPVANTDNHSWPLQVYPRTLAVLAQVLLLKPQEEKAAACISIWQRLINTLVENITSTPATIVEAEIEDLNVEHAQLVLFLFHSLNLMQKKSVLLGCATGVIKVSEKVRGLMRESQILHLSRLLLLLDYLVKHLYDAPAALLEQVQWNLLSGTNILKDGEGGIASRLYCPWNDIDDVYKFSPQDEFSMRPRFYSLTYGELNNQEPPKLCGLACNFILGSPEKMKYPLLMDALVEILSITDQCTPSTRCSEKIAYTTLCAIQYCFLICWRLLLQLPPSTPYLEKLAQANKLDPNPFLLHSLVWGPRTAHKTFIPWMKDCLVKQGMYTQYAESALKNVADAVNNLRYDITLAKNTVIALTPQIETRGLLVHKRELPTVMDLCLLNAVLAKIQAYFDHGSKNSSESSSDGLKSIQSIDSKVQVEAIMELLPHILNLTEVILACSRSSLMYQISELSEGGTGSNTKETSSSSGGPAAGSSYTTGDLTAFRSILAIISLSSTRTINLSSEITPLLPTPVLTVLEKWNETPVKNFPWSEYANDLIPGESYVMNVVKTHISVLSSTSSFSINPSLKHLLHCLVSFISEHIVKVNEGHIIWQQAIQVFTPLTLDVGTECVYDISIKVLEKAVGDSESDKFHATIYVLVLEHIYTLILNYTSATSPCSDVVNEKILHECLSWMEELLEKPRGRQALEKFFEGGSSPPDRSLVQILLSVASPRTSASSAYGTRVFQFFNKLFSLADKNPSDECLEKLCASILELAHVEAGQLSGWLHHVILGPGAGGAAAPQQVASAGSTAGVPPGVPPPPREASPPIVTLGIASSSNSEPAAKTEKTPSTNDSTSPPPPGTGGNNGGGAGNPSGSARDKNKELFQENQQLLQHLTTYIVKQNSGSEAKEAVALTLLEALVPMASQLLLVCGGQGFPQLMYVMAILAGAGSAKGHLSLFLAASHWISLVKDELMEPEVLARLERGESGDSLVESACAVLRYVGDIVHALGPPAVRAASPPWEGELLPPADPPDLDWMEELTHEEDDESGGDESDEDSLCNKLCTFTFTQKEFMNQHWYHCHTCKMIDRVGVCSVCARVCHKGHDVTYAKYGNFFCDCGARESGSCLALTKRNPASKSGDVGGGQTGEVVGGGGSGGGAAGGGGSGMEHMLTSSLRRRPSSPCLDRAQQQKDLAKQAALTKLLEHISDQLSGLVTAEGSLASPLVTLLRSLLPAIEKATERSSPVGCHLRTKNALKELHSQEKKFVFSDQIMVPTLGSQEGAFENVRMNYSGEQGQTIRQLMSAHMIRRVAMCCLASPHGKRQHLAVAHEKGKITILQLGTLLKQADSSKRKLTLTRLSSAPVPFTVLTVTSNPANEDFLAVCGLKDCHVLTFTSGGSVSDHLVLHPQLEIGNFIIRALWLPGSQTKLALVTADFVKIYDLALDVLSPQYYFLVPTGKIRDVTFNCTQDGKSTLLLMASTGYIYTQDMNEESSAQHGAFYVTSTIEMYHPDLKDSNGQICGGGVSLYYSHALRLLFFSYSQGKSFIAALGSGSSRVSQAFLINLQQQQPAGGGGSRGSGSGASAAPGGGGSGGSSSGAAGGGGSGAGTAGSGGGGNNKGGGGSSTGGQPQPLCLWTEVPNHPGLVTATLQTSNNPVILMIHPDTIYVQEIKVLPAKAKIMDMVVIRHVSSNAELRTTLLILCEDGSLRIYNASPENTGFWLSPSIQAISTLPSSKATKKKKTPKPAKTTANVSFPVDFFEHCILLNDVEFGGNDLLQIYNPQQIKHRLNTTGMYVVSTKSVGFSIEIINNDAADVITGFRVLLGNQDIQRVPAYIEVNGRSLQTNCTRSRWYDFPLTREESAQADKKLIVTFGPSLDPDGVIMVDSIKVYGKTKEAFGWPEEAEDSQNPAGGAANPGQTAANTNSEPEVAAVTSPSLPLLDRMVSGILEVLDGCFALSHFDDKNPLKTAAVQLSTRLLTLPTTASVQKNTKALLAALHSSNQTYHNYKDQAVISYVIHSLNSLRKISDSRDLDTEAFYRLVLMTRSIAISRPNNLVKFSQSVENAENGHLVEQLTEILWRLHSARPHNNALASVCIPGLTHVEATVFSLVEIIHAFTLAEHSEAMTSLATKIYLELLLCRDQSVCFSAKQAIIRVLRPRVKRRRVFIPSPPHCSTPGSRQSVNRAAETEKAGPVSQPSQDSSEAEPNQFEENVEPIVLLAPDPGGVASGVSMNMEALLGGVNGGGGGGVPGFAPMLDIPPDADDETMVELAIALSLQDHDGGLVNLQAFQNLAGPLQALASGQVPVGGGHQNQEAGHYSDTTASAGGSDDEGSTAATDGSTLRTSPADQGGSGGSESGGSGVDSITGEHNVSGRSSAYGEQEALVGARSETSSLGAPGGFQAQETDGLDGEAETEMEGATTLHNLRLAVLEKFVQHVPNLQNVSGVIAIPFMQVVLMLSSEVDGEEERGRACLESLISSVLSLLRLDSPDLQDICTRTCHREVQLVVMRLLSVLMSRPKSSSKSGNASFVSQTTANMLLQSGVIDYCLVLLKELIPYWKNSSTETDSPSVSGALLKPHLPLSPPDMSPFFLRQYVKGHATDVFEAYPQLLTEMALRLPYQVQKHTPTHIHFPQAWFYYLCEYMMSQQTPFVRRQVRKLLLFICGNKERYRQRRDLHALESHMKSVKSLLEGRDGLSYDSLVEVTEHLKACVEVGTGRTGNWRKYCLEQPSVLGFLVETSCSLEEAVAAIALQLLQCALCPIKPTASPVSHQQESGGGGGGSSKPGPSSSKQGAAEQRSSGSKSHHGGDETNSSSTGVAAAAAAVAGSGSNSSSSAGGGEVEDAQCLSLVRQLNSQLPRPLLTTFMRSFLLDTNSSNMRWQAHALILSIYRNSESVEQEALLEQLWSLWPHLPFYGRKAAQFVDLLGYFSIKSHSSSLKKMEECIEKTVRMLQCQNQMLLGHPNASLYSQLAQYVELEGYYLESDPCLVCNNPELPMTNIKLSSIKIDSKFTTTTQIVKLVSSHTISKITLRIADLKRTKMVRTMNIYYNNRSVQAVVELKNKPAMWHKAKKVTLASGQTEVKVEFPLPIVACNLMIEYADFYENLQASSETLQCPRCSSSVPANPGVCGNCGENVFQCHKCRAINYDEKDPFLCHACGFCKYAKFDFTITGRPCCAVDPIENDEDRKKTIAAINSHLEKADRVYKQLVGNKPTLEMLLLKITEQRPDRGVEEVGAGGGGSGATSNPATAAAGAIGAGGIGVVGNSSSGGGGAGVAGGGAGGGGGPGGGGGGGSAAGAIPPPGTAMVNRAIQLLAQRYCTDCKTSFEDLSRIIQKVLACRGKLLAYDRSQLEPGSRGAAAGGSCLTASCYYPQHLQSAAGSGGKELPPQSSKCYGCALSATEHCLVLLRALAASSACRQLLCQHGLVRELIEHNLRRGSSQTQEEVRQLICLVTADNLAATRRTCSLLMERIALTLRGHLAVSELCLAVRPGTEMCLLAALLQKEDSTWEHKLRCVMQLFLMSCAEGKSPVIMDSITLPCLKILQGLVKPEQPVSKKYKEKSLDAIASVLPRGTVELDVQKWLKSEERHSFATWRKKMQPVSAEPPPLPKTKSEVHERYLLEKYSGKWRERTWPRRRLTSSAWLRRVMFNPSSRPARQVVCQLVECLAKGDPATRQQLLDLLTSFLDELGSAGEAASEYLGLLQSLLGEAPWRQYLALRGVLLRLADLITSEIAAIHRIEETLLTSDLSQGYALKMLTELLASFLEQSNIKQVYKGRLVGAVLNGYLSLRRLVVQRTRLIDETQDKLLELLEEMTTGTEEETKAFMTICIETVEKCSLTDVRTPVFIFERLCSIIYPEENDVTEFFLTLEKDPQQEDFLQGRMLGNPYSCNEPGLGPLMRDVKNKICQDCELIALLEDDNGMELLVNNKIISLDLPVKEVYKKIWVAEGGEGDAMRVVYRMRGLLGDATEEFVETLLAKSQQEVDNEELYKMANVMADCGGLKVLMDRLSQIKDTVRSRSLLQVILKLLQLCVKVSRNQEVLCQPELGAISTLLNTFQLCISDSGHQSPGLIDQILEIMETILSRTAMQSPETFLAMSIGGTEYINSLLDCTSTCPSVRSNPAVLSHLARVLASLTYSSRENMAALMSYFRSSLQFDKFDAEHTPEDEQKLELFSILSTAIDKTSLGDSLKDYILSLGIVDEALDYICKHAPAVKPTVLHSDSDEWKEFISKPSLKYILRFLTGLASHHRPTQDSVSLDCITIIHRLEQVSSDEHVGSLAENLLEALRTNEAAAAKIEEVRGQTRAEKKWLAMAMREKQLAALGMRTNDKGQLRVESTMMQQMEELGEETGLVCVICREGYKFQPAKVLGVYTFTKRCNVDDFENKIRKTIGYSTVTHFNVVHVDCHMSAVRLARVRDEWESAALQNANTKCNGLLPLWGPQVPESAFASCLARHNTYLQEATGHRDISYSSTVHDLKLLLLRFAQERSFHEDAGGGGPQSNMYIVPYLMHMALYVINTTRCSAREVKNLSVYVEERRLENCYEAEGPYYYATLATLLQSPQRWATDRLRHLDRLLLTAHMRHVQPGGPPAPPRIPDLSVKPYHVYKSALVFWALIDAIYNNHFKKVPFTSEDHWPTSLADYIRHNDEALMKSSERLMATCNDELLPCTSFEEFCDVVGLLEEIPNPSSYIAETLVWFA